MRAGGESFGPSKDREGDAACFRGERRPRPSPGTGESPKNRPVKQSPSQPRAARGDTGEAGAIIIASRGTGLKARPGGRVREKHVGN
jgi:hypothetical protein